MDKLGQRYAAEVLPHGLLGTLGHVAHNALHIAAHVASPQRLPLIDEDYRARCHGIVNLHQGNVVRAFSKPGPAVFAGERLDQPRAPQREQQPAHDHWIRIYARGECLRINHFPRRESEGGQDVNGESKLLVDHTLLNVIVSITV
jgi:hypothetical protein